MSNNSCNKWQFLLFLNSLIKFFLMKLKHCLEQNWICLNWKWNCIFQDWATRKCRVWKWRRYFVHLTKLTANLWNACLSVVGSRWIVTLSRFCPKYRTIWYDCEDKWFFMDVILFMYFFVFLVTFVYEIMISDQVHMKKITSFVFLTLHFLKGTFNNWQLYFIFFKL